ncbi:MAG: UDP-glucose 4-epimerase GalE [Bacteroidetes bacterium]|nr:UDP-glucose 4-epimerase GalE [Bacteroidota bacterium]
MKVLVTGGAGYIGSHTCIELLDHGHEVIVIDNLSNSHPRSLERVQSITQKELFFYEKDLLDKEALNQIFQTHAIDAVIHFAGYKAVGESVEQPLMYYQNNIQSTLILCETMQRYGVHHLVFSSSATVYGMDTKSPIPENAPLSATNPYGRTKLFIEEILRDWALTLPESSITLLRYFNPVGAHSSGLIGEDPQGIPNNLMPYVTQVASGRREILSVFGNDYDTLDGTGVRDYIHVVDLALGHVKALEHSFKSTGCDAYNLGTGNGTSVLELVKAFEQATGQNVPYQITDRRPGDVATCFANPNKAKLELSWEATRDIVEMCKDSWNWQSKHPMGYQTS